ncbi:MAG: PAS domain S-box protein, partial [Candidatus Colwellbacteria bacterium]|nr:PAS domain S-box protein [Candidatus Colwellbacteria bacterium]
MTKLSRDAWIVALAAFALGITLAAGLGVLPLSLAVFAAALALGVSVALLGRRARIAAGAGGGSGETHNRLAALIEYLDEAILGYDENFTVTLMNPRAEEVFGISRESAIGEAMTPNRASERRFRLLAQVLFPSLAPSVAKKSGPGEEPQVLEMSFNDPKRDLAVVTLKVAGAENGNAFFKIVRDRTREKGLIEGKSEFVSTAAHELRTPLT